MYGMNSSEYMFVQYVVYSLNQTECHDQSTFTYDSAVDFVKIAGLEVTEYEDPCDDMDDE